MTGGDIYIVDKYHQPGNFEYYWAIYKAPYEFKDDGVDKGRAVERFAKKGEAVSRASEIVRNNPKARGRIEKKFSQSRAHMGAGAKVIGNPKSNVTGNEVVLFCKKVKGSRDSAMPDHRWQPALTTSYWGGRGQFVYASGKAYTKEVAELMVDKLGFNDIRRHSTWSKSN